MSEALGSAYESMRPACSTLDQGASLPHTNYLMGTFLFKYDNMLLVHFVHHQGLHVVRKMRV